MTKNKKSDRAVPKIAAIECPAYEVWRQIKDWDNSITPSTAIGNILCVTRQVVEHTASFSSRKANQHTSATIPITDGNPPATRRRFGMRTPAETVR